MIIASFFFVFKIKIVGATKKQYMLPYYSTPTVYITLIARCKNI